MVRPPVSHKDSQEEATSILTQGGIASAVRPLWVGASPREDAAYRFWPHCGGQRAPTRGRQAGDVRLPGLQCVQRRLACSVGVSPTGVEVRSPVAWIASVEETKPMKPIDKAILGMVSESPGRNESEPRGGLVRNELRRPSLLVSGEGSMEYRRPIEAMLHSGGVEGQHGDKDMPSNWRSRPRPIEKSTEQDRPYNRRPREVGRRRDGGGRARSSNEAG